MNALRLGAILAAGLIASQEPAPRGEPGLESLAAVAKGLDEGIAAVIKGTKPAEAFKPWKPETVPIDRTTVLLGNMKSHGITAARTFAIELKIELWSAGKGVYRITALAHATPGEASILSLAGQLLDGAETAAGIPIAKCGREAEPFKDAAESLVKRLKENRAGVPVFADDGLVTKLVPKPFQEQVLDELKKSRAAAPRICRAVADAKYDEIRLQLDEQYFTTFGADGSTKDAFVRGKLRLSDAGEVMYRLNRLETE